MFTFISIYLYTYIPHIFIQYLSSVCFFFLSYPYLCIIIVCVFVTKSFTFVLLTVFVSIKNHITTKPREQKKRTKWKNIQKKGCLLFALQNSRTLRYSWTNNCGRSAAKYAATFGPSTLTHQTHTHTHTHACMECHENRWRRESQIDEFIKTKKNNSFLASLSTFPLSQNET